MGDADDRFGQAVNDPEWNFRVAAVEALAARVLKDSDPELADSQPRVRRSRIGTLPSKDLKTAAPLPEVYGARMSWSASRLAPSHRSIYIGPRANNVTPTRRSNWAI